MLVVMLGDKAVDGTGLSEAGQAWVAELRSRISREYASPGSPVIAYPFDGPTLQAARSILSDEGEAFAELPEDTTTVILVVRNNELPRGCDVYVPPGSEFVGDAYNGARRI